VFIVFSNENTANSQTTIDYKSVASKLNTNLLAQFYDSTNQVFRDFDSAHTLQYMVDTVVSGVVSGRDYNDAYVFWPTLLTLYAFVEGERAVPGTNKTWINQIYNNMEIYFSPKRHAYSAWIYPDNYSSNNFFYDDNSLAVVVLCDAYVVTGNVTYLNRAWEIMSNFVYGGWQANTGGMLWGTDTTKQNTSDRSAASTTFAAVAALKLANLGINKSFNITWASGALDWVSKTLIPATKITNDTNYNDYLVQNSLTCNDTAPVANTNPTQYACASSTWTVTTATFTYNSGNQILGRVLLYQMDPVTYANSLTENSFDIRLGATSPLRNFDKYRHGRDNNNHAISAEPDQRHTANVVVILYRVPWCPGVECSVPWPCSLSKLSGCIRCEYQQS